jgi:DNA-binding LytR/AlgR family response regulator
VNAPFFVLMVFFNLRLYKRCESFQAMEEVLKILLVDDEPEARELLKFMLLGNKGVSVVGVAGNVDDALKKVQSEHPHLVLLDIQMPEKDGFSFIKQVHRSGENPGIIFVTAYEHYAIQAIRNSVFDYILKPVHQEELDSAIERFRSEGRKLQEQDLHKLVEVLRANGPTRIKLNTRSGYVLIDPSEVVYCQADGNYTHIQLTRGNCEITTQNLGTIEEILKGSSFFRASRSYLLNLKYLSRVDRKSCSCILEYPGKSCSIKIPAQKIRMLESTFPR